MEAETRTLPGPELCGRPVFGREGRELFIGTVTAVELEDSSLAIQVGDLTVLTKDLEFVRHRTASSYGGHKDHISMVASQSGRLYIDIPMVGSLCIMPDGEDAFAALKQDYED